MSTSSIEFIAGLLVLAALFFYIPGARPRQILLGLCNLGFLMLAVRGLPSWVALGIFVLSGYAVAWVVRREIKATTRRVIFWSYLAALLAAFVVLKEYAFINFLIPVGSITRWVSIVGLSYMLFRQIHLIVDSSEGQIERLSLWTYLNYQLGLFTLYAGPIQRYQDFTSHWDAMRPVLADEHERMKAYARLLIGILKVSALGAMALSLANHANLRQFYVSTREGVLKFALLFYLYPLYIYFNFSGYCDIVIAGASLVGIRLPENFNEPFLARNIIDYWNRWHITLTHWIRDYIFIPLYKKLVEKRVVDPKRASYLCYFIALFLAGLWHGSTWNFVIFGFLHGSGISVTKMWEERILRKRGRPGLREYLKSKPIQAVAIFLTFHYVCFAFLFFPTDLKGRLQWLEQFFFGHPPAAMVQQ